MSKNRPRLIANPERSTLGLPQAISSLVQHELVRVIPEFVCGKNLVELAATIQAHDHLKRAIWVDGSAFDSNQHRWLQEAVQGRLWDRVGPHLESWLALNGARTPYETAQ